MIELRQFRQFIGEGDVYPAIIVDDRRCWHIGASIKDAGGKTFMISELEDPANREALKSAFAQSWQSAQPITFT